MSLCARLVVVGVGALNESVFPTSVVSPPRTGATGPPMRIVFQRVAMAKNRSSNFLFGIGFEMVGM